VALLSYLAPKLAGALLLHPQTVWPLWPGCALLVPVLLLVPRRIWPIVTPAAFAAFVLYDLQAGVPVRSIAWFIPADTVEVLIAAFGLSYFSDRMPRLNSLKALGKYLFFVALLAPFTAAFLSAPGIRSDYWTGWKICFFSEVLALVTLTPAILGWVTDGPAWVRKSRAYHLEFAGLMTGLVLLSYITFTIPESSSSPALLYSLVPFLLWAALRFGSMGVSSSVVVVAFLSIWGAVHGRGPFTNGGLFSSVLSLQLFLVFAAIPFMVLAALVEERKRVEEVLRESEERLRLAMEVGKLGGWEWDIKSGRNPWFGEAHTLLGMTAATRSGSVQDFWDRVHPENLGQLRKAMETARQNHGEFDQEFRVVWPDGTLRWLRSQGRFFYAPDGEPERMLGISKDITKRKQVEQALRQSEAELMEAQRLANVGSWRWDLSTDTVTWSEELYRIAGLDPGLPAVSYKEHSKLYTAESWDCLRRAVEEALRTGTPYELDLEMIRFDGARRRLIAKGEVRRDSTGQIVQLRGTVHDITERKRTEEALRESDERLRLAVQAGRMYAFEWDIASDVIVRTGQCRDILNWMDDPTRDTGRQFVTRVHPDDREAYSSPQTWLTPENPSYQTSYRVLRPDGAVIWLEASGRVLFDAEGKRLRIVGLVADVTARKLAEEARRESDERLRLAQEAVHVGVFEWDIQKNENRWSPELERIYGLTPGSFGGTYEAWIAHVHPEDRERFKWDDRWNLQDGGFFASEYRIVKPSGEIRWLNTRGTLSCDSAGRPVRLLGFSIDITERKTAEEALRESEARERARVKELETLLDAAPITILIAMDAECKSITANRTASRLHHVPIGTNISLSAPAVGLPLPFRIMRDGVEIPVQELPLQRAAATGIPVIGTFSTLVLEDGTEHYMFGNTAPLFGEDGKPCGAVGAFVDITEHKRAEDALRQSEERLRLAAQAGKMFAYEWDATTDVVVRSPESAKILGIDEATHLTGQQILAKVHPGDRERLLSAVAELSPEKPYLEITYRMERPDGTEIWVERNSRAQFDGQGRMQRIVGMVADITERKRVELALRESEERLHLAFQAGGMYAYEWDPLTDRGTRTAECINILGKDAPLQITRRELSARVHPDDREQFAANPSQITPEHPNSHMTYRVLRHDGSVIWLEKRARAFFDEQGRMLRMIGVVADVTARKHAEEALRESEERFRLVANTAPVMIWMSGPDKQCNYFNQPWLDFTGRAIESELGNGWAEGVLLEDFKTCLETYTNAFDRREKFSMEYRLRRYDGEYRWVLDIGVPRFNQDGSFAGYIGSCLDVTERKRAEEALSSVSRRLIEAQEQERTRIARELHDDIGQRLALLTIELEQLRQNSPDLPAEVRRRFGELQTLTSEIATDVQSLSHELHSSRLEYLGIAAAMKAFCKEFANQQNVEVVFAHDEVPRTLPQEISLCLFRVLQEALQNAVKHSGMRHFDVELHYASDAIDLNVRDSGRGFDVEGAMQAQGLGLISMAERLKLVGGQLSIDSQSQRGTTIRASVPLSNAARASA